MDNSADARANGVIATEVVGQRDAAIRCVGVLGNHLPRHCGIATFTTDLAAALADAAPLVDSFVLAVNDPGQHHAYPTCVRFEITEGAVTSYQRSADYLNVSGVDVVSVQHEFGIFGGQSRQPSARAPGGPADAGRHYTAYHPAGTESLATARHAGAGAVVTASGRHEQAQRRRAQIGV